MPNTILYSILYFVDPNFSQKRDRILHEDDASSEIPPLAEATIPQPSAQITPLSSAEIIPLSSAEINPLSSESNSVINSDSTATKSLIERVHNASSFIYYCDHDSAIDS